MSALYWLALLAFSGLAIRSDTDWRGVALVFGFAVSLALLMHPLLPAPMPIVLPSIRFWV